MCIIVVKPKHKELQNKNILERCFTSNKDGAGYMFVDKANDVVEIKKGFMNFNDFYKSLIEDYKKYKLKDQTLVMHFRIGTSGKSATGCTHPFPVTTEYSEMEKVRTTTNIGVCHNGIVSMFNSYANTHSDTQIYIKNVIAPIIKLKLNAYMFDDIQNLILKTTNSKWVFLDKFDNYYTIGEFINDDGYLYSNTSYKPIQYVYTPKYNYYDDYDDYDNYDYKNWFKYKAKSSYKQDTKTPLALPQAKEPSDIIYKPLKKGMALIGGNTYVELVQDKEYYIDKNYNAYTLNKQTDKFDKVLSNCIIYNNTSLATRVDYSELGVKYV